MAFALASASLWHLLIISSLIKSSIWSWHLKADIRELISLLVLFSVAVLLLSTAWKDLSPKCSRLSYCTWVRREAVKCCSLIHYVTELSYSSWQMFRAARKVRCGVVRTLGRLCKAVVLCSNKIVLKNFRPELPPPVDRPTPVLFFFISGVVPSWNEIKLL